MALYSLVAWPPALLARWMREVQRRHGLAAFGAPHLNVRTPFEFHGDEARLVADAARVASVTRPLEVDVGGLTRLPHMVFVLVEPSAPLLALHEAALALLPAPPSERDAAEYLPHLTLALGICPWAEADVWRAVKDLRIPVRRFAVAELALTREQGGDIVELARYPLASASAAFTM